MQNSTEDDIKFLVKMQKRNPKLFEKLMNGKIKIDNLKLIDTKEIAQNNGNLNTLIQENSITVETFNEISNLEKLFGTEIKKITVKIEPEKNSSYYVEFFQNAEQNMPNLNIALNSLPEEFLKYLDIHDKTKFTLSIEK